MADDHFLKVPGRLMRTLKTGRLSGLVGGSYIGGKLFDRFKDKGDADKAQMERHLKNARRIVETMAELRGPMMKVGQLLSTHAEALPQEVVDILSTLQKPFGKSWPSLTSPMHVICGSSSSPWDAAPMETPQSHI